ncbi:MAG: FAD-dependent oxidoreductase, partial [Pseudomonadota bacterium]|nr:FAD-dependent oxidoreductase [Pseudomonadota bacterium]
MNPIIIIGTGLAGFNLLKELRKIDADRPITLITSDDGMIYSKPMLSAGFGKEKAAEDLVMATPEKLEEQYNITVLTHTKVEHIDEVNQQIETADQTFAYDSLVLALGANTVKLPLSGDALDRVYSVNDLMDYRRFREALNDGVKDVAIIGGGLIGCEFANDLSNGGFNATIIEPEGRVMPLLLPEAVSEVLESGLKALGTEFKYGHFAIAVNKTENGRCEVVMEDGSTVEADLVVSAVGLRPRIAIAESTGLNVNRGILVDRHLQTSD